MKNQLFNRIADTKKEPFFVATGCWHPTFHASYADVNVLLMYALSEIGNRLKTSEIGKYRSKMLHFIKSINV